MALALNLSSFEIITDDCTTVQLSDNTGSYDVDTNPTGYGTPNIARSALGLRLFAIKKPLAGDEVVEVTNYDSSDPGVVAVFRFTNTDGGIYNFLFCAILDYGAGETYNIGEITYDPSASTFYRSKVDTNIGNALSSTTHWENIDTTYTTLVSRLAIFRAAQNAYAGEEDHMIFQDKTIALMCNLQLKVNRAILDAECGCVDWCSIGNHNKLQTKADAVVIMAADGNYTEAEEIYENAMNMI